MTAHTTGRRRVGPTTAVTEQDAAHLERSIAALGDYAHVHVHARRGHLSIYAGDRDPIARATPLGSGHYGLSFHSHAGLWERLPVTGNLELVARALVETLAPYFDRPGFSDRNGGSDH
jgi:hypothetical protein